MNISGFWGKILGMVAAAILATLKLPGPLNEIIQNIIDAITNNPQAAVFATAAGGLGVWAARDSGGGTRVARCASRFAKAMADAVSALTEAGVDVSSELGAFQAAANKGLSVACREEAEKSSANVQKVQLVEKPDAA